MKPVFLLDTNILSEPLRPAPDRSILDHLRTHQDALATAAPVWHELNYGCRRLPDSAKRKRIEAYLDHVVLPAITILPYDSTAAKWHADQRARLVAAGKTPSFVDGQIAAIAAVNDLVLVTVNVNDYAHFDGLRIVDWRAVL